MAIIDIRQSLHELQIEVVHNFNIRSCYIVLHDITFCEAGFFMVAVIKENKKLRWGKKWVAGFNLISIFESWCCVHRCVHTISKYR